MGKSKKHSEDKRNPKMHKSKSRHDGEHSGSKAHGFSGHIAECLDQIEQLGARIDEAVEDAKRADATARNAARSTEDAVETESAWFFGKTARAVEALQDQASQMAAVQSRLSRAQASAMSALEVAINGLARISEISRYLMMISLTDDAVRGAVVQEASHRLHEGPENQPNGLAQQELKALIGALHHKWHIPDRMDDLERKTSLMDGIIQENEMTIASVRSENEELRREIAQLSESIEDLRRENSQLVDEIHDADTDREQLVRQLQLESEETNARLRSMRRIASLRRW